ncbi:ORF42 [Fowl aviadenovirus 4]|uniref:ORF 42 n=1 Tax=Fowl aviadenovirus 4 TaxID=130663 RepID=A0A173ADN8_FADV4|nr:ORF 42 [Fowl aviadenovirus 4]BCU79999.1 ORF42 [Fowl aviadenovirus 4]
MYVAQKLISVKSVQIQYRQSQVVFYHPLNLFLMEHDRLPRWGYQYTERTTPAFHFKTASANQGQNVLEIVISSSQHSHQNHPPRTRNPTHRFSTQRHDLTADRGFYLQHGLEEQINNNGSFTRLRHSLSECATSYHGIT